jgi:glycerol-3-phosphate O-acyltransferase
MEAETEKIKGEKKRYKPVLPRTRYWPIVQLNKNKKAFIDTVTNESLKNLITLTSGRSLKEELESTVYRERLRMKQNPWKVDPKDEKDFWNQIQKRLIEMPHDDEAKKKETEEAILREIIKRYANEISGNFKNSHYRFARTVITFGFARLLNATRVKGIKSLWSKQLDLDDKIHVVGQVEQLRRLARRGTIVMVPTHFSNLDSILIGWVIQHMGLPPFIYGAGLNLFNIRIFAYFMNSLGAYKVDRRKKNLIYLETLKTYSQEALKYGCHSLFFPGGTRSRSGAIETQLKLGLLSTTVAAQREHFEADEEKAKKIFIVPVVLNYHFVLEAPSLINDYLERKGQERYYVENDEYSTSYKIIKFLLKFFTRGSDISVSIGRAMDVFGNYVDNHGNSLDRQGNPMEIKDYFTTDGVITFDAQREQEYTRILAKRIVEEYHKYNRVFSSHLVAFTAFEMIKRRNPALDLYNLLRLPDEDTEIDYAEFRETFSKLREEIFRMKEMGKINFASHLDGPVDDVIKYGIDNCGMYHALRPILKNKKGNVTTQDMNRLFYYYNRMDGYDLEKFI